MSLIPLFDKLKNQKEAALIIYTTAGFPDWPTFMENLTIIAESGADLIEVGVPFSDPIADGPVIQYASQVALENDVNLNKILESIHPIEKRCPIVLMSYLNPLIAYGKRRIFKEANEAGFSGLIIPDLPVEEASTWSQSALSYNLDLILLVAPTSSESRIRTISEYSNGFLYCVSLTGTTGVRKTLSVTVKPFLKKVRRISQKPIAVGFGISNPEQIRELRGCADGVIVGSRIIEAIHRKENLEDLIRKMKSATRIQI